MSERPNKLTVLFLRETREELREYLGKGLSGFSSVNLIFPDDTSEENLVKLAPDANVIIGWRPSDELLGAAENLRLFINPGVGVQHLVEKFRKVNESREVLLANGHGNTFFTAQHTVAILLALLNKVVQHHNWMMEGRWRTGDKEGESIPLRDRTVGFLGYGAVNSKVHKLLSGFDIEFCILKRDWNKSPGKLPTFAKPYDTDHLPQFLIDSDILIVGVPQTSTTTGMIGSKELELLGENGIVVNVSRGPVIDEESLFIALQDEKILGAAIDVWYEYRPEEDGDGKKYPWHYPFHELDNVVLSPHRAASPMGDLRRWNEVIENISRLAEGRDDLLNLVDLDLEY